MFFFYTKLMTFSGFNRQLKCIFQSFPNLLSETATDISLKKINKGGGESKPTLSWQNATVGGKHSAGSYLLPGMQF